MANCNTYQKLSTREKVELIGQLTHCVQNDEHSLLVARALISTAKTKGILDNVHVWPEREVTLNNIEYAKQ